MNKNTYKRSGYKLPKKAYNNYEFLNSPSARVIRVLAELIEPQARFKKHNLSNTVVFFGSARTIAAKTALKKVKQLKQRLAKSKKPDFKLSQQCEQAKNDLVMSRYYEEAAQLSEKLTAWFQSVRNSRKNFIVCSGGGPGIMEAASYGAKKAKGESVGLNISLPMEQFPNHYLSRELTFQFHYFFIRKFWFFYPAKAIIVFPGGYGTLDEFFELLTLVQTNKSRKFMPIVLYGKDYWEKVVNFDEMVKWGMISPEDLNLFKICNNVDDTYNYLKKELTKHYLR